MLPCHPAEIESFPSNPNIALPLNYFLRSTYSLCGCGMALKLKAKQEKCTYTGVENLHAYSLQEKREISAFVHNCRRNIKNVVGNIPPAYTS